MGLTFKSEGTKELAEAAGGPRPEDAGDRRGRAVSGSRSHHGRLEGKLRQ